MICRQIEDFLKEETRSSCGYREFTMRKIILLLLLIGHVVAYTQTKVYITHEKSEPFADNLNYRSLTFLLFDMEQSPGSFQMIYCDALFNKSGKFVGFGGPERSPIVFTGDFVRSGGGQISVWFKLTEPSNMLMTMDNGIEQWTPHKFVLMNGFKKQIKIELNTCCKAVLTEFYELKEWNGLTKKDVLDNLDFSYLKWGNIEITYQHYYLHPRHHGK